MKKLLTLLTLVIASYSYAMEKSYKCGYSTESISSEDESLGTSIIRSMLKAQEEKKSIDLPQSPDELDDSNFFTYSPVLESYIEDESKTKEQRKIKKHDQSLRKRLITLQNTEYKCEELKKLLEEVEEHNGKILKPNENENYMGKVYTRLAHLKYTKPSEWEKCIEKLDKNNLPKPKKKNQISPRNNPTNSLDEVCREYYNYKKPNTRKREAPIAV